MSNINKNNEFIARVPRLQVGNEILEDQTLKLLQPQLSIPDMTRLLESGGDFPINTVFMISKNEPNLWLFWNRSNAKLFVNAILSFLAKLKTVLQMVSIALLLSGETGNKIINFH